MVAVADGITRDPPSLDFLDQGTLLGKVQFALKYPRPSPAKIAADTFCDSFLEFLLTRKESNESILSPAFAYANQRIKRLNQDNLEKVDYLENDFWACVASGGIVNNNKLYWSYITDCGVCVFDKGGELKFRTTNDKQEADGNVDFKGMDWKNPRWRRKRREEYRNNPEKIINGQLASFGALTGEETALPFVKQGQVDLEKGDYVLFYSDGIESTIYSEEFREHLSEEGLENLKNFCKKIHRKGNYREGTLVASLVE